MQQLSFLINWLSHVNVCKNCPKKEDPGSSPIQIIICVLNLTQSCHSWHPTGSLRMVYMDLGMKQATNSILSSYTCTHKNTHAQLDNLKSTMILYE